MIQIFFHIKKQTRSWVLISFFATIDVLIGNWIPFIFPLKIIILVNYILTSDYSSIDYAFYNVVKPIYNFIETNDSAELKAFFNDNNANNNDYYNYHQNHMDNNHNNHIQNYEVIYDSD